MRRKVDDVASNNQKLLKQFEQYRMDKDEHLAKLQANL
jgi:outer membrane murein-binding lipoprotein Lpp